tara:strand:- start:307 stop:597 length:291 start_codon:yes stop_codon:yes gene_type:complete
MVKEEEIILPKNRMYVIMSPITKDQFNIMCVDKMEKPIGELYFMMRGLCEMSIKHQEDLIEIGKEVMLQEKLKTAKKDLFSNIIPFRPRRGNGKKH